MFHVYILKLVDNRFYIGYADDLKRRLEEHKRGTVFTTQNKISKLVFYASFENKKKALDFEKYLKSSSGFAFRNKRLV